MLTLNSMQNWWSMLSSHAQSMILKSAVIQSCVNLLELERDIFFLLFVILRRQENEIAHVFLFSS